MAVGFVALLLLLLAGGGDAEDDSDDEEEEFAEAELEPSNSAASVSFAWAEEATASEEAAAER